MFKQEKTCEVSAQVLENCASSLITSRTEVGPKAGHCPMWAEDTPWPVTPERYIEVLTLLPQCTI